MSQIESVYNAVLEGDAPGAGPGYKPLWTLESRLSLS